jgi:hypothetical protein
MTEPTDAFEAALKIADALGAASVPYALGGALAYGQYGVPRATNDVDVNIFVEPEDLAPVLRALATLGIPLDPERSKLEAQNEGMFSGRFGDFRVDVFTPSIDFAWEAGRTRVRQTIEGRDVYFLSAEALAVFKLLFFRTKDLADLERLIAVQGSRLDAAYVRAHVAGMMGEDDPRIATWDRLVQQNQPA